MNDHEHRQVELCRGINRKTAQKFEEKGVEPADIVIAAIYSAHDLASALHGGDPQHRKDGSHLGRRDEPAGGNAVQISGRAA